MKLRIRLRSNLNKFRWKYFFPRLVLAISIASLLLFGLLKPYNEKKFVVQERNHTNEKQIVDKVNKEVANITLIEQITEYSTKFVSDVNWIYDKDIVSRIKSSDYHNCSLCSFKSTSDDANSSRDDLVLGLLYGEFPFNFLTLVRSIRTTGCKASVVIFACNGVIESIRGKYREKLEECGVNIFPLRNFTRVNGIHGNLLRHMYFALFLNLYHKEFKRVIILDVYDTFFQKDPFTRDFENETVLFSYETIVYQKNRINWKWIRNIDKTFSRKKHRHSMPLCSGLFGGTSASLINFYNIFVNIPYWEWIGMKCQDQGVLNYLYLTNKLTDTVKFDDHHTLVSAFLVNFSTTLSPDGFVMYRNTNHVPYVIHQYDRICFASNFIKNACPVLGDWHLKPYGHYNCSKLENFPKYKHYG